MAQSSCKTKGGDEPLAELEIDHDCKCLPGRIDFWVEIDDKQLPRRTS